ncbi:hypothetical protein BST97_02535 [Nonlabens spongiae]|uniref:DUF1569 domain-containing protein n=1 Tax=Nonlabens spongiae TaxID=331648 RepID=A0A1W6MHI2_9FLAO|nr:DUF1569 domain-containing protein [Nonlabens spongiae]ARN76966.1 hypothetical protein BST97_02535 [Nonlabens spongiae]
MQALKKLENQLAELHSYIELGNQNANNVSKVGTYWHIDHSLNVIKGIIQTLEESNPKNYAPKFSFWKWVVMTFKTIPRGKGKAPKQTLSAQEATHNSLLEKHASTIEEVAEIPAIDENKIFKHPLFGWMKKKETVKFITIHTHHHLKIIRDIVKKN